MKSKHHTLAVIVQDLHSPTHTFSVAIEMYGVLL